VGASPAHARPGDHGSSAYPNFTTPGLRRSRRGCGSRRKRDPWRRSRTHAVAERPASRDILRRDRIDELPLGANSQSGPRARPPHNPSWLPTAEWLLRLAEFDALFALLLLVCGVPVR